MRTIITFLFSIITILLTSLSVYAQEDNTFLDKTAVAYNAKTDALPIEKVYLHLDKPNYLPGDTIWFKAYAIAGKGGKPSEISGVLYTELVNAADSVVSRVISEINSGITWGDLTLSSNIKRGNYHLRSYTNWMRNAGAEYFYDQQISVGGNLTTESTDQTAGVNPDIQFMPEGGELVNGIRSKVAFKAVKPNGLPESISGTVLDNDNKAVAELETMHAGMGIFPLLPEAGKTYTAKIKLSNGSFLSIPLPKAKETGYTMQINNSRTDSLVVKISANSQLFQAKQNSAFYLIAQSGGVIYYTTAGKLNEPISTASVIKNRFPYGIVQFTLFDDSGQPVSERIAFITNDDTLKMSANGISKIAHPREHTSLNFTIKNSEDAPAAGTFSIAVINQSRVGVDEDAEGSIYSHLLLKSDLKGYIEKPNYYFNKQTPGKLAGLDVLMLTQGYRKFEWRALNNPPTKPIYDAEQYLSLEGSVKTLSGAPVPNSKVSLTSTREGFFADTIANAAGNFKFDKLSLTDTAKIALQARKEKGGKNVSILVKLPNYPVVLKEKVVTSQIDFNDTAPILKTSGYGEQLKADSIKIRSTLPQITVTAKRIAKPDRFNMYGVLPERLVDVKRMKLYNTLQDAARWAIPGIFSQGATLTYEGRSLAVSVNGLRRDVEDLSAYDPAEIDNIRLISGTFNTPPLLLFTTKSSTGTDTTVLKEVVVKAKRSKSQLLTRSSNLHGAGNADQVLMGDKLVGCVNIADCLRGKLFGVTFKSDGTPVNTSRGVNRDMVIIVDGVQLPGSELNNVVADNVLSIETLITAGAKSIYGASLEGGALIITNKIGSEGKFVTSEIAKGIITYPFKGFHIARKYYAPKYVSGQNTGAPDLRSGIYWKPDIVTDSEGKFSIDYFNGDTKGTYRIVLEGIDENGNLGRQVYNYSVK